MMSLPQFIYEKPNMQDFLAYVEKYDDLTQQIKQELYKKEDALYWALDGDLGEIATWLIEKGAKGNANAVYAASQRGYFDILKILVDAGAPFDQYFHVGGFPPLIAACSESSYYYRANLKVHKTVNGKKILVTDPAEIEKIAGKDKYTDFIKIVAYLLEKGANPNDFTQNKDSLTALHWCAHKGGVILAEMLLNAGAKVDLKSADGLTPLHYAARGEWKLDIAKLLLEHGANINAQENYGFTPLHEAVENKNEKMVTMLLEAGADTSIGLTQALTPYTVGFTALDIAKNKRFRKISGIIKKHMK